MMKIENLTDTFDSDSFRYLSICHHTIYNETALENDFWTPTFQPPSPPFYQVLIRPLTLSKIIIIYFLLF